MNFQYVKHEDGRREYLIDGVSVTREQFEKKMAEKPENNTIRKEKRALD